MSRQQSFQHDREISIDGRPSRLLINVQLNFNDAEKVDCWQVRIRLESPSGPSYESPEMPASAPLKFQHVYRNQLYIRGTISLRQENYEILAVADLTFGTREDRPHFFEGAIMQVPGTTLAASSLPIVRPADEEELIEVIVEESEPESADLEPDDPDAEIVVLPPDRPIEPTAAEPCHSSEEDVFPYVFMRKWPAPAPELELQFTRYPYPLDAHPTGAYLQGLYESSQSKTANARADMESASVAYIAGRPIGTDAPFVGNIDDLGAPINTYPRIYQLLTQCGQRADGDAASESSILIEQIWSTLNIARGNIVNYLFSQAHINNIVRVWQNYLALVIKPGGVPRDREQLTQVLIVEHALRRLLEPTSPPPGIDELAALSKTIVILPKPIFPLPPKANSETSATLANSPITVYAIGDLLMVKQRLRGYQFGELAHVESIQIGEQREFVRFSNQLTDQEHRKQTTVWSLSNTALDELASTTSATNYQNFSTSYGPALTATSEGGWTVEHTKIDPSSRQDVTRFARDILSRTVNRMNRNVAQMRTATRTLGESEGTLTGVIDNRTGKSNRRVPYYWLNKVYDAYVVNYGNRMFVEMRIAEPAERLIQMARKQPAPPSINSYSGITRANFAKLVESYPSSDMRIPPEPKKTLSLTLLKGESRVLDLPAGYQAVSATLTYTVPSKKKPSINGIIGQTRFQADAQEGKYKFKLSNETGNLDVTIEDTNCESSIMLTVVTHPSKHTMNAWRLQVFQAIHRTYTDQLNSWRDRDTAPMVGMPTGPADQRTGLGSSARLRAIERQELRKAAIDLLFVNTYERIGGDMPSTLSSPSTAMSLAEPRYMYFFESSFEWADMSYSFMGQSSSPDELAATALAHAADDQRFQRFLNAAYARLLVPVNLAHAPAVLYQLATGAIWDGSPEFVATTEADVDIRADLVTLSPDQARVERVSEPWTVVVPTGIAVLGDGDLPVTRPGEQTQGLRSA